MTEKEIQLLGFKKETDVTDQDQPFYYYVYEICNGLSFITNADDEVNSEDDWFIEFIDTEIPVRYTKFEEAQALLNNIEKHIVK
jgi:hypothetical protein